VTVYFGNAVDGGAGEVVRADVLICADGIHSAGRRVFYPDERLEPEWNGVQMWRGAALRQPWRDGESMAIGGGLGGKFVLYPIAPKEPDGRQLMNWVVNIRTKDPAVTKPPPDSWSRRASKALVLPHALRFTVPGFDIEGLVRATGDIFEYPMADRDPLPHWTFGRVTLMGDAAHPMYPEGSNGASQAILDARCLADNLARQERPRAALWAYERERLPKTAEIARQNRAGGPEGVIDEVEKRAPAGFRDIDDVLSHAERQRIVRGYATAAGFARVTKDG
jgi:2-polyprenyl-6-methoxyphenol hydroxylase-like FAD-dependent oxidoreductase